MTRDISANFIYGDFYSDKDELKERRSFMSSEGYQSCSNPACNCNSFHGGHAGRRLEELSYLLQSEGLWDGTILKSVEKLVEFYNNNQLDYG